MSSADDQRLRSGIIENLNDLNKQILVVVEEARKSGIDPHQMRYADGKWVLNELYSAKSQTYLALVMLSKKD